MGSSRELRFFHGNTEIKAILVEESLDENAVCWLCSLPLHGSPFYKTDPPGLFQVHAKCAKEFGLSLFPPHDSPFDFQHRNIASSSSSPSFTSRSPSLTPYPFSQPYPLYSPPPPPLPPLPPPSYYGAYYNTPFPPHHPHHYNYYDIIVPPHGYPPAGSWYPPPPPHYYNNNINSMPPYVHPAAGPVNPQNANGGTWKPTYALINFASSALGAFLQVLLGSVISS